MNKKEFIRGLEQAMLEQMDISEAASHIRYYQDFIENEVSNGRSEEEVVASLQSPRLIAKNIIDNGKSANKYKSDIYGKNRNEKETYNKDTNNKRYSNMGCEGQEQKEGYKKTRPISFSINGKPIEHTGVKIALITIAVIILMLVVIVVSGVLWIISRLLLPVVLIGGVVYLFSKFINKFIK